ncbi:MFS transporter, partial [Streptomyces sp. NPDC088812]
MTDTGTGRQAAGTPVQATGKAIGAGLLSTLALLMGLASFGIDLYLPAFPVMTTELSTTATGVQLSLTAFLIGAGAGQLVFGPWSDRAGRVVPLVFGAVLFVAASVTATLAGSIELLVAARLVQGLGGAAGMVIGRAIILDRARGTEAARALSIMMLIGGIAPIIAPVAGGALVGPVGWRGLLGIVTGLGVIALACVLVFVRESLPREIRRARAGTARRGGWRGLIS